LVKTETLAGFNNQHFKNTHAKDYSDLRQQIQHLQSTMIKMALQFDQIKQEAVE